MSQKIDPGLRERKRQATHRRIATEAARLAIDQGVAETTVEQIAAAAEVGRASVFRYFDTKEGAVAEGLAGTWLAMITDHLAAQPPSLGAISAIRAAFAEIATGFDDMSEAVRAQAELSRSSPALSAWTLQVYLTYEAAIAELVAPRFDRPTPSDPRPRLVAAMVMAGIRLALDDWVAADGTIDGKTDLPTLIDANLASISIRRPPAPRRARARKRGT
jgi:AcrR family transcriptional regulator